MGVPEKTAQPIAQGVYEAVAYEINPSNVPDFGRGAVTLKLSADTYEVVTLVERSQPNPNEWEQRARGRYVLGDGSIQYFNDCGEARAPGYWYAVTSDGLILWEGGIIIRMKRRSP